MKNNILLNTFLGVLSLFFLNACEDSLMGSGISNNERTDVG